MNNGLHIGQTGVNGKNVEASTEKEDLLRRRIAFDEMYRTLFSLASLTFWLAINDPTLPLEVLVRAAREFFRVQRPTDGQRVLTCIMERTQAMNTHWARHALGKLSLSIAEYREFLADLCADMYEGMVRALSDPTRHFWEENFMHALYFERKHVLRTFMRREGFWERTTVQGSRIPRSFIISYEQYIATSDSDCSIHDIEDEKAEVMLRAIEDYDLYQVVLALPDKLKATVWLLFWEGRTEKEIATLLGVSDRTVRNRLRTALDQLRSSLLVEEEKTFYA